MPHFDRNTHRRQVPLEVLMVDSVEKATQTKRHGSWLSAICPGIQPPYAWRLGKPAWPGIGWV